MGETWTILKVLQWTTGYFTRHGIEQPRANAEVLLAHALGKERLELYLQYDRPLSPEELALYRQMIQRRATREPTQYIIEKQEFWSMQFEVNPSVLIPRPETELIVEMALDLLPPGRRKVLDVGTGSGAIAVSLARERPDVEIIATDASYAALLVAERNARRHGVTERIGFVATDLFSALSPERAAFDLIVSNPPYIGEDELSTLAPEVEKHEPHMALCGGGEKGLDIIRRILLAAPFFMESSGVLLLELGLGQAELLQEELTSNPEYEDIRTRKDYSGITRILHLRKVER